MKTTKEAFENLSFALSKLGKAILESKQFEWFLGICLFCIGVASLWLVAAFIRLLIEIVIAGYNWTL